MNEDIEMSQDVKSESEMLRKAESHIDELHMVLREKEAQIARLSEQCQFYEQILKNLTTFKG